MKKSNAKIIEFSPHDETTSILLSPPSPAKSFLPQWFKDMPPFVHDDKHMISNQSFTAPNTTVKHCPPFLDSMTFGYIWSIPVDIQFEKNNESFEFKWRSDGTFITVHDKEQFLTMPEPKNGYDMILKWAFGYSIKTPTGYSCLFTHPFNRHDLPFRTFSGVVDTDEYNLPVQFPFQIIEKEKNFFIIEKNTPIVQIIPFKRENWNNKFLEYDEKRERKKIFDFKSKIVKSYKNNYWHKKDFK